MSVLACDRNNCDNIMCDRLSNRYGYICNECFEELIATGPTTDILAFMHSKKSVEIVSEESFARYNAVFVKETPNEG